MSYLVLARKYRPQTFEQVIEQAHITRTLTNAISTDRVAHAILFSGPRGTGKTTVARILAKSMNCEQGPTAVPCNVCRSCEEITGGHGVDVFEIDGASNNSVDQVRELRENIKYMPAHSAFKIYIIDEVHMLSMAAFNALLKTLEEPPSHVLFMFATTEPHKIPITILSRCQRHDFRRINLDAISKHMTWICRQEGFEISDQSLGLIAREAGGSMRDALSLLDQIMTCTQGSLSHEQVLDLLGVIDRKLIHDLAEAILTADVPAVLDVLDDIYDRGHDMKKLYADLLEHFRNLLVVNLGNKVNKLIDLPAAEIEQLAKQVKQISAGALNQIFDLLYREEVAVRLSPQPKLALEMALIRLMQVGPALPIDVLIDKLDDLRQDMLASGRRQENTLPSPQAPNLETAAPIRSRMQPSSATSNEGEPERDEGGSEAVTSTPVPTGNLADRGQQIIETIARQNPSLAANLAKCQINIPAGQLLEIEVPGNGFTLNMIQRDKNMAVLNQVCADILGSRHEIQLKASGSADDKSQKKKDNQLKQKAISHPLVADAIEIFDGKLIDVKIL
ncbi:DNA polymerase III subunits gamma and tau (EC [Olavius sp. associated proteobacterium Delta 1]|nr:DNA polymerase III subunits gamma and tau (EC [Olavius sp. associated proteobacterium Delta 1]